MEQNINHLQIDEWSKWYRKSTNEASHIHVKDIKLCFVLDDGVRREHRHGEVLFDSAEGA